MFAYKEEKISLLSLKLGSKIAKKSNPCNASATSNLCFAPLPIDFPDSAPKFVSLSYCHFASLNDQRPWRSVPRDSPITWNFIGGNKDAESLSRKVIGLERPLMDLSTEAQLIQELCLGTAPGVLGELS
ncbi:hypothetical protein CDAR_126881 [Caerostris darwini]|uniref:Uncharacterized protein n=1 Tax=Caerostris darwini TaxID=1538125 RepID=A0AAV4TA42_9ARAC|nr:hypothetical protein CDAR_126881 [Caerostris darwini]